MSDGVKPVEDGSPNEVGAKRAGRARICKQCKFTTTDVREFSNHRLHAHAEENPEDKTSTRKNSMRRKSSSAGGYTDEHHKLKEQITDSKTKINSEPEVEKQDKSVRVDSETEKLSNTNKSYVNNSCNSEMDTEHENMEMEPSPELLNSLALAPRKSLSSESGQDSKYESDSNMRKRRPTTENVVLEKMNGMKEQIVLVNKDDDQEDEDRLVIAEDSEMGDPLESSGSDINSLLRSGNIQNRNYLCGDCSYTSNNAKDYLHHQKDMHEPDLMIYECDICDYATRYKQKLPRHRKLHFSGKEGESDLDSSLTEREIRELNANASMRDNSSINETMNGEEDMDDDGFMDDEEDEDMVTLTSAPGSTPGSSGAPTEKKKRIRQEVDPLKYYEVVDDIGIKYACSKCGNVYKWRKSLNKHWKEKHFGEVPDLTKPPATLQNYTLFSRFKAKYGGQPPPPKAANVVYGPAHGQPANQVKARSTPSSVHSEKESSPSPSLSLSNVVMPRQIGPFIAGTNSNSGMFSPQVSLASLVNRRTPENHHELRQMMENIQQASSIRDQKSLLEKAGQVYQTSHQSEPLDFSKPLDFSRKTDIKTEPGVNRKQERKSESPWNDTNSESDSLQDMPLALMVSQANSQIAAAMKQGQDLHGEMDGATLKCSKCSYVAKTLVDYTAHMSLHLNKRAFKCAECQAHFNGVEELNKHFLDSHAEKIQEHKEAIQKIPHGLQQTYHLLKMPLDSISGLSSQELMSNEPKQLKCSMCNFVAKWPAELQKHAVSHSEERPFVCMVCASTYKWKWDLVKHFEKSHSTLPNPYKRREGGGVIASTSSSPSSTPLDALSKTAALIDASLIMSQTSFGLEEDMPPNKKRRLSETEIPDDFYRELLDRQIRQRREMAQSSETPTGLKLPVTTRAAYSEPPVKMSDVKRDYHSGEDSLDKDSMENNTPKRNVHEALKQRLHFGRPLEEEASPSKEQSKDGKGGKSDVLLPYKCSVCEYRARWPSEISQHMKNHSNEKPFHCPRCSYKSKWKWDVVKHLRRCGGGTVHDVIDTTKLKKMAPPNVTVLPQGGQQNTAHQSPQIQKTSPNQPVFPGNHHPSSLSPAISPAMLNQAMHNNGGVPSNPANKAATSLAANFAMAAGGQDHPEGLEHLPGSAAELQAQLNAGKQTVFRSLVNQGMHHCLECPFVGNSQAELRRHSLLHSENKPFSCLMCGYSTRWKCDLKKHQRTYGHYNPVSELDSGEDADNSNDQPAETEDDSDEENKSTLYMCPQCPYNSYKKNAFDNHLHIHGSMMDDPETSALTSAKNSSKYKCSKCSYHGNDLSSFLQHKRSHNQAEDDPNQSQNATLVPGEVSNRTIHLKNRRKPVKQFKCDKCPFICFSKPSLEIHHAMHIPRGSKTYLCMFCDYNVFSKTLLLQHMRLHPEYNPAECSEADGKVTATEIMEMEGLEEKEITGDDSRSNSGEEEDDYESAVENESALDFSRLNSGARTSTPVMSDESKNVSPTNNNNTIVNNNYTNNNKPVEIGGMNLPCEWCSATFPNVVALYQHSQSLHPSQLKAQEAGDLAAQQAPSKGSQMEQIVRERPREYQVYHQFMAHQQPQIHQHIQNQLQVPTSASSFVKKYIPLAPKPDPNYMLQQGTQNPTPSTSSSQEYVSLLSDQLSPNQIAALRARKSASIGIQKKARSFQCTKCSFTAPNAVTYLRHIEHHGSNCKHTCRYCDYSIDRLNLLYQHMKGTHPEKWQGTWEEKLTLSIHSEDSNNNIIDLEENTGNEELNASFNSSQNDSLEGDLEVRSLSEVGAIAEFNARGVRPIVILNEEISYKGTSLHACLVEGKKHYKCTRCLYINSSPAVVTSHFLQHGKDDQYKCPQCDYSVDTIKQLQTHIDNIHPKEQNFILVSAPRTSILIDDFPPEINNSINGQAGSCGTKVTSTQLSKNVPLFSCPKCPYKTPIKEKLKIHSEQHSYNGKFECQLCDYSVDQYSFLRSHARLHNTKFMASAAVEFGESSADELSFEDQEFLNRSRNRSGPKPQGNQKKSQQKIRFKCSCCPFFTFQKSKILAHRLNHINKSPFACQMCTFSSKMTTELEDHVQYHNMTVPNSENFIDVKLDPFSEMYRVIEKFPNDEEEIAANNQTMDIENEEDGDNLEKMDEDIEDDEEMALMEEELRDTLGDMAQEKAVERNLTADGAFDTEIQFRNFKCENCPYSSNSHAEYKKHCRLHGTSYKFKCDYCSYSLDRVNLISQHRKLHFQEKDFEAAPLMYKLLNKDHEEYQAMIAKVGMELAYPPAEGAAKIIEDNTVAIHQPCPEEKLRYSCHKCPYKCQAQKSFRCHLQMHGLNRKYKCDYCDWSTDRLNLICQHRRVHAHERDYNPNPGDIVFLNREYVLDGQNNIGAIDDQESHLTEEEMKTSVSPKKNAKGERIYYCKLCPFSTESINTYSYHKKLHCIQASYSCSECSYSINNINSLKEHIKLHKKERELMKESLTEGGVRHKCPKCPFSSPNKNLLVAHTSMHSSGRKYTCTECDFSTDDKALLNLHAKVHNESYSDSDSLEEMELMMKRSPDVIGPQLFFTSSNNTDLDSDTSDTNDSELKCEKCPFSTPSKDELGTHVHQHETPGKSRCMYCSFSCAKEEDLLAHVQVHFPGTSVDKDILKAFRKQSNSHKRNISKALDDPEDKAKDNQSADGTGEPDSTVNETSKQENKESWQTAAETPDGSKESEKTKVYVCQYCEREFDCKSTMIKHEKQHLF